MVIIEILVDMKNTNLIIISAIFAFGSCVQEFDVHKTPESDLFVHIDNDDVTKTVIDEDNNILWESGDQILAFLDSKEGLAYQIKDSYIGKSYGYFSKVSDLKPFESSLWPNGNVAYYPYSDDVDISSSSSYADYTTLTVTLPSVQKYAKGSFGNGVFPMVASSKDRNFSFRNICGGIKLQLKGTQRISSIKIEGKKYEKLSGAASVTTYIDKTKKPVIRMQGRAETSVTLDCGGVSLNADTPTEFIIVLPPTDFTEGFTVTVTNTSGGRQVIETDKANQVLRSSLLVMPEVTVDIPVPETIEFNPDRYIVTTSDYTFVPSGDSFWGMRPFLKSRVSDIGEIELKFQMSSPGAFLFSSERPEPGRYVYMSEEGIELVYGQNDEMLVTWDELGMSPLSRITLNISVSKGLISINGNDISVPGLKEFTDIEYLFSSYYYIDDDGYAKVYASPPSGSKLYYAKIWDQSGNVVYHGYAAKGQYSDGTMQYAWKSEYANNTYHEFSNTNFENFWVSQYTWDWMHFGGGMNTDMTPVDCLVFKDQELKEACVNAFDTDGDNEISYKEAAAVTDLSLMNFPKSGGISFDIFESFTSVKSIPESYFAMCGLKSIRFPKSLQTIGKYAFNECFDLESISLPENIKLEYGAFRACEGLEEISIPSGITWTTDAFWLCHGLKKVTIEEGVTMLPNYAFGNCSSLTTVSISSTVTDIWQDAFYQCKSLTSIKIPEGVKTMDGAFRYCENLTSVNVPSVNR